VAASQVTVGEVWRLAFPEQTQLLAGRARLGNVVQWTCVMRPTPPAFPRLEGNELALINSDDLRELNDLTLARVVRGLHKAQVAAIAVAGAVEAEAIQVATELEMPLFALPPGTAANVVERAVIRLIVDREAALERYRSQVARQLAEVVMANRGWDALAAALAAASRKSVVIQDSGLRVVGEGHGPGPLLALSTAEVARLGDGAADIPAAGVERLVTAIRVEGRLAGYLSLLGSPGSFDVSDQIVAEQGALLCGLELAKERAASSADAQQRAHFLQELLNGGHRDPVALARRARAFGYDPSPPQMVLVLGAREGQEPDAARMAQRLKDDLAQRHVAGFVAVHPEADAPVVVVYPLPGEGAASAGRRLARSLIDTVQRQFPQTPVLGGLSRPLRRLSEMADALHEAEQAWSLGRRLAINGSSLMDAAELGIYRLLLPLAATSTLRAFCQETLGELEAYDRQQGSDLVHTLDVYFAQLGNLSRTAEAMHLHRNTLIYRLERIAAILGVDLDDAETRLRLQVALKARQLL
jgi:purine catabolism regulator